MSTLISPSILSADFGNLERDILMLNTCKADWLHVDIMDGQFVPNISFGFPIMKVLQKIATKPLDVHLMIERPENYLQEFKNAGAAILTIHYETCIHLHRTIQTIKELGIKAGVALNPHTSVSLLKDILHEIDVVLLMSVNPGFGGQQFIPHTLQKVRELKSMILQKNSDTLIEVDGGINLEIGKELIHAGADALVAGSFIFNSDNPTEIIEKLKEL